MERGAKGEGTRTAFNWRAFLRGWNDELLRSRRLADRLWHHPENDIKEAVAAGWLGYPGAPPAAIEWAEARLGATLPPSYRAFLMASNGWRDAGSFVQKLWSTDEIAWLATRHRERIDAWLEGERTYGEPLPTPDEQYFVYGEGQESFIMRSEYLETALDISEERGGDGMYLLNPRIVTPDGEWEAWFWAAWLPGARRYRSFQELLIAERDNLR